MRIFVEGLVWKISSFIHADYTSAPTFEEKMASTIPLFIGVAVLVVVSLTLIWFWERHKKKQALKEQEGVT